MRHQSNVANWLLSDTFDSIMLSEAAVVAKEPKFPLTVKFGDFVSDEGKEKSVDTKEKATKTAARFNAELKGWKISPNENPEFSLKFAEKKDFIRFCKWLGASDVQFTNTKQTVVLDSVEGALHVVNEAEELEGDDEDAIDVDKALKVLAKIEKYSEKLEDEKLEKLVADLKKALGAEDEEEETEEKAEKGSNKPKADLDDLDDLEG